MGTEWFKPKGLLRPAVIWRKKYFGTRSDYGSDFVARTMSLITSCRLQAISAFEVCSQILTSYFSGQKSLIFASPTGPCVLWLKVGGTPEGVYQYISILKDHSPGVFKHTISDEKFCSLSHDLFYSEVFGRFFPPLCITTTCTPNSDTTITFSDCGESSLRNFINILIKNNDEFILDSSYLEKTNLNIDARVIKFYKDNNSILDIKKIDNHNQWAQIVSELNTLDPSIK